MSTRTQNLGLFKYNTTTDSNVPFSIDDALNANWDILDTKSGSPETVVDGTTWYRRFTDGWKEQGGLVSLAETEIDWVQPVLTSDGTVGQDTLAAFWIGNGGTYDTYSYQAFDKNTNTYKRTGYVNCRVGLYTPYPIKVSEVNLDMSGNGNNEYATSWELQGSNNYSTWDTLYTGGNQGMYAVGTVLQTNQKYYKYHCIYIKYTANDSQMCTLREITFKAKIITSVANSITFPVAFSNTNYSYTFACQDGGGMDAYVNNKTITGMTLSNTNSGSASWTACGY